jgi:hypothetical protein
MRGGLMASANAAATAAGARAAECHRRAAQLAQGQHVDADDARRARGSLVRAGERAALARRRLIDRQLLGARLPGLGLDEPPDAPTVRGRARRLDRGPLFEAYFALGGVCTAFELDAFVHAALELPHHELSVLAQAIWELTEL